MNQRRVDRVIELTAARISAALVAMERDLPDDAAPQMAIELVVRRLAHLNPWFMRQIMEHADIREAYAEAVAERSANPGGIEPL
jgi:hypothetical protein